MKDAVPLTCHMSLICFQYQDAVSSESLLSGNNLHVRTVTHRTGSYKFGFTLAAHNHSKAGSSLFYLQPSLNGFSRDLYLKNVSNLKRTKSKI